MGPSQSAQHHNTPSIQDVFPVINEYKPINMNINSHLNQQPIYRHQKTGKTVVVRTFDIYGNNKSAVQNYYLCRSRIKSNPHVLQLFDMRFILNKSNSKAADLVINSNLCSVSSLKSNNSELYNFWLLLQSPTITLQDQIHNRVNKKSFQEIQLWSVISSCVLGSLNMLQQGCKQPVLSPKGIGLTQDGVIKVGEWQFVSKINHKYVAQDGQVIFGKFGQPISQINRNSLNQLLLNYYWAPEGLKAMQNFMSIGKKQNKMATASFRITSQRNYQKFQIFSLGMTLISMCLRNCYYRADTFSQKYLTKLTHQAIQIRKIQGKQLSPEIQHLIQCMVKWDPAERISYVQLRDQVLQYFNDHPQEMKNSGVTVKTFQNLSINQTININNKTRNNSQASNLSMNLTQQSMNSYSFETGFKFNAKKRKNVKSQQINHIDTLNSRTESYQGSGTVQQGNGDYDQNLQEQKEQIFQESEIQPIKNNSSPILNNPITHRTQKSLKQINQQLSDIKKDNSPYLRLVEASENICPNSTPIIPQSPNIYENVLKTQFQAQQVNYKIQKKQSTKYFNTRKQNIGHVKNQIYLNTPNVQQKDTQNNYNIINQQKKPQSSYRISINNLKITTNFNENISFRPQLNSNRGSYRSSNKQPPNLSSARHLNQKKIISQFGYQLPKQLLQKQKQISNKIQEFYKIQYSLKPKLVTSQQLEPDQQDQEQKINYQILFGDQAVFQQQVQNPDIFQTFQQLESIYEPGQSKLILPSSHLSHLSSSMKFSYEIPKTKSLIASNNDFNNSQEMNRHIRQVSTNFYQTKQYVTFNQNNKKVDENFSQIKIQPSKWKKSDHIKESRQYQKKDECLFTDPRLLEYIKSPLRPHYSIQSTSRFNTTQFMSIINQKQVAQSLSYPSMIENKQNYNHDNTQQNDSKVFKNYLQRNSSKDQLKSKFQNEIQLIDQNCQNTRIVKEKVSRGFYQGQKKNGLRCGYGVFYYNQGGKYKGNWLNNQMHGKGTLQYADGRIAYQGDWNCDQLHGKGVLYNQSPNFVTQGLNYKDFDQLDQTWIFYEGTFQHDDKSGIGLLVLSNQQQFIGQFKNDMVQGVGQYLRVDGSVIKGVWHQNKLIKEYEE